MTVLEEDGQTDTNKVSKQERQNFLHVYWGKAPQNDDGMITFLKTIEPIPGDGFASHSLDIRTLGAWACASYASKTQGSGRSLISS